jgi:hypothetical protein
MQVIYERCAALDVRKILLTLNHPTFGTTRLSGLLGNCGGCLRYNLCYTHFQKNKNRG